MSGGGSRSSSNDEYVILDQQHMLTDERLRTEKALKNIFQMIALFRYDDAKSAINMVFDSTSKQSGNAVGSSTHAPLRPILLELVVKEREYVHSDLRKIKSPFTKITQLGIKQITSYAASNQVDRLKAAKEGLRTLAKDVSNSKIPNDVTALVRTVAIELEAYITARFTKLHDQIITPYCNAEPLDKPAFYKESLEIIVTIKEIIATIKSDTLSPLKDMLLYETNVTEQLFSCSLALTQWEFVGSLLHLQTFNETYKKFLESYKSTERALVNRKAIKGDEYPELYKWFYKVYELLLSKYTLYFSKTLFQDNNKRVLKSTTTSLVDYRSRLIDFGKKTKASSISLILNIESVSSTEKPFLGHGCKIHSEQSFREVAERHCYKDKFDVIFHHGREDKMDENIKSEIVHLYCDVYYKSAKPYIFDQTKSRTYFISLFDVNVFLAVVYATKKGEKDGEILKFIEEFKNGMNLIKV